MSKTYLSVCSGIEAATVAWHPLGWRPWAYAEIEPFPCYVLDHHYGSGRPQFMPDPGEPDLPAKEKKERAANINAVKNLKVSPFGGNSTPNLGDMTQFKEWPDAVFNVLVGGTPCQSYSVAGLGKGLDDPRGDLMLTYVAIARRYRPAWVVWENVPGVLSNDGGRSFGTLLGLLTGQLVQVPAGGWQTSGAIAGYKSAYGIAWRVLDSQFVRVDGFGRAVPQRRRRVFVVGYLGDWRRAAAVLFERQGLSGDPAPRREAGKNIAGAIAASSARRGGVSEGERGGLIDVVSTLSESSDHARPVDNIQSVEYLIPVPEGVTPTLPARGGRKAGGRIGTDFDLGGGVVPVAGTLESASAKTRGAGTSPGFIIPEEVAKILVSGGHANNPLDENLVARRYVPDIVPQAMSAKWSKGSSGPAGDEVANLVAFAEQSAFSFKASHFTRDKDGAPADVFPPLSADADKGDQDPLVCAPIAFDCKAGAETGFAIGAIPGPLRGEGHGGGHTAIAFNARQDPIFHDAALRLDTDGTTQAVAFQPRFARNGRGAPDTVASALTSEAGRTGKGDSAQVVAYGVRADASRLGEAKTPSADAEGNVRLRNPGLGIYEELAPTIDSSQAHAVATAWAVRRLTPVECERLQAFTDGYTDVPWRGAAGAPDGPRYKALGNSMSVNAMRWLGQRIDMVDAIYAK